MCGGAVRGDDRSGNEVSEHPIARGRVVAAVVYIHRFTRRVEEVNRVERTRFERLLEKRISVRRALFERRTVVERKRLLGSRKRARRVVLIWLKHMQVHNASRRSEEHTSELQSHR